MKVLVVGASGATGRLLVRQLLDLNHDVIAIVRSPERVDASLRDHARLTLVIGSPLDLPEVELAKLVRTCDAVASCLGHNLTLKGIYGAPRRLVTESTARICSIIRAQGRNSRTKFVLMNTAGNSNRDLSEPISFGQRCVIGLLRVMLPPHVDNERAADYLRALIGPADPAIEWCVVRPDTLIDAPAATEYDLHPSPTRSAIFDPGQTSRINVAHFMAQLITQDAAWSKWKGRMPVIYNRTALGA